MNSTFVGKYIIKIDEIDSTNNYANEISSHSVIPEGAIVVAKNQLSGKGQRGSSWISEADKNLTVSYIFYPKFLNIHQQFYLNMAFSLAVLKTVSHYLRANIQIKWPNDIWVDDEKIAGILIENQINSIGISKSIVGIGLNVNQSVFEKDLMATSLSMCSKHIAFELIEVLETLNFFIEKYYVLLKQDYARLKTEYLNYLLGYQKKRCYLIQNEVKEGIIVDITKEGKLALAIEEDIQLFDLKEIVFMR
jgi:BirA family transcriptional regulator, biotin operon repressor / biotin---[acetyl-CoA-carboxylase] ligase